jgi:hypothetical protein
MGKDQGRGSVRTPFADGKPAEKPTQEDDDDFLKSLSPDFLPAESREKVP